MNKGKQTKSVILKTGLEMASQLGLENISIGHLSQALSMSKSGLFAHFQSKENLQLEILQFAANEFVQYVLVPALALEAGETRIKALVNKWISWGENIPGGCIFVSASTEFSDRPGAVRDLLQKQQQEWILSLQQLAQSAIKADKFREDADVQQFAFELYALLLGYHNYYRLLNDPKTAERYQKALSDLLKKYENNQAL